MGNSRRWDWEERLKGKLHSGFWIHPLGAMKGLKQTHDLLVRHQPRPLTLVLHAVPSPLCACWNPTVHRGWIWNTTFLKKASLVPPAINKHSESTAAMGTFSFVSCSICLVFMACLPHHLQGTRHGAQLATPPYTPRAWYHALHLAGDLQAVVWI